MVKFLFTLCFATFAFSSAPKSESGLYNYVKKHREVFEGWCSEEKSVAMAELIVKTKPKVCVEIGVFGGSSVFPTAAALKYNSYGTIYAIDPWSNAECTKFHNDKDENTQYWGKIDLEKVYRKFFSRMKRLRLNKQCRILRMTSEEAVKKLPAKIDILHIDGNHQKEASYYDTTLYFPRIKVGGYIWFDDVGWVDPITHERQARRALDFLLEHCELTQLVNRGGCVLFKKIREA